MSWATITRSSKAASVRVHGVIFEPLAPTVDQVLAAVGDAETVHLSIDSPGGDSMAALRLGDSLAPRVVRVRIQTAASAAYTLALAAGASSAIEIEARGAIMLHSPQGGALGSPGLLRQRAAAIEKIQERLLALLTTRTALPAAILQDWIVGPGDHWFTAEEAIGARLVDAIRPHSPLAEAFASPAQDTARPIGDLEPEAEGDLLLEMMRAIGPFKVRDRKKFFRSVETLLLASVEERPVGKNNFEILVADGLGTGPAAPAGCGEKLALLSTP